MGIEIERRFIVASDGWREHVALHRDITQGYICDEPDRVVRVRHAGVKTGVKHYICPDNEPEGFLTIKGASFRGQRVEVESKISEADAKQLLRMCRTILSKRRSRLDMGGVYEWVVDEFYICKKPGLIICEVEIPSIDAPLELPSWLGEEVTDYAEFANTNLALTQGEFANAG